QASFAANWTSDAERWRQAHRTGCDAPPWFEERPRRPRPAAAGAATRCRETPRRGSPVRPHQAAVQALDREVLVGLDLDRVEIGIARQQPDPVLAHLQQLDR